MEKLLITGSEGKIGTVLKGPLNNLYEVYAVDQVEGSSDRFYQADISYLELLKEVFKKIRDVKYVIHLAADSRIDAPWESILKNNIIGTKNVYGCAKLFGVRRIIFASSNHVTGGYEGIPPILHKQKNPRIITIHDPVWPDSDYGSSKLFGEGLAKQYLSLYGIQSICLRIGTVTKEDDPTVDERMRKTWLSHRDLTQLVIKALQAPIEFGIYYGVSNNRGRFWDIANAQKELGYQPVDNANLV